MYKKVSVLGALKDQSNADVKWKQQKSGFFQNNIECG